MITRKQSVDLFSVRMDELIGANYILADKKITNLLKTVTASKLFYSLISYCAEDYDYESEKIKVFENGSFRQPKSRRDFIAFGFSFLYELDAKTIDLLKILDNYFLADNFDKSYKYFAEQFLVPFKQTVAEAAYGMIAGNDAFTGEASKASADTETDGENDKKNYFTCYSDIQKIIVNERTSIIHGKFKDDEKKDLLSLLDAFKDGLFMGNKEQVRLSFLSYKYAVMNFKKLDSEVDDIERILRFCGTL